MTPQRDGDGRERVDILRPRTASALISARTFEHGFVLGMGQHLRIEAIDAGAWPKTLLTGVRPREAARTLAERCAHADFLCPSSGPLGWSPELLRLRNLAGAPVRALLIAHAPGLFLPEWALLAPLLGPGDRIIAPSETAAAVIAMLCPQLSPHVRVIPHPIPPWLGPEVGRGRPRHEPPRLVGLGRLARDKLLHRQIEALAILRGRGLTLRLDLAGPLHELGGEGPSAYVRSLRAKIERLGLGGQVRLCGPIEAASDKLDFVRDAAMLLDLSVSLEESFGKAIAEALSCGVPSLCTRWGGLAETGGAGARALATAIHDHGVDLDAETIADGVEALLSDPPSPACCHEVSRRFDPETVAARYRAVLDEAREEFARAGRAVQPEPPAGMSAAPATGLLAGTAPLTAISWAEAMELHGQELRSVPDPRGMTHPECLSPGAQLRGLLCLAARTAVQRVQAGLPLDAEDGAVMAPARVQSAQVIVTAPSIAADFLDRCARAIALPGTRASRLIIVDLLQRLGQLGAAERGLAQLQAEGLHSKGMRYLEIEARLRADDGAQAVAMCEQDFADHSSLGEHEGHRLSQYARACHRSGRAGRALPALRSWTDRFPDGPDAAGLWQQRALLALLAEGDEQEARMGLSRCVALLGPRPELLGLLTTLSEGA